MVEDKKLHSTFRDPLHYQQTLPVDLYETAVLPADYLQQQSCMSYILTFVSTACNFSSNACFAAVNYSTMFSIFNQLN
jgi:hypothetical protein